MKKIISHFLALSVFYSRNLVWKLIVKAIFQDEIWQYLIKHIVQALPLYVQKKLPFEFKCVNVMVVVVLKLMLYEIKVLNIHSCVYFKIIHSHTLLKKMSMHLRIPTRGSEDFSSIETKGLLIDHYLSCFIWGDKKCIKWSLLLPYAL